MSDQKKFSYEEETLIIDTKFLKDITRGKKEVEMELLKILQKSFKETIENLNKALVSGSVAEWYDYSHKYKGSASSIRAVKLRALMTDLCQAKDEVYDVKKSLIDRVKKESLIVFDEMEKIINSK